MGLGSGLLNQCKMLANMGDSSWVLDPVKYNSSKHNAMIECTQLACIAWNKEEIMNMNMKSWNLNMFYIVSIESKEYL